MGSKPRIGDVYELATSGGLRYLQYHARARREGPLLKVLPGFHLERPTDLGAITASEPEFYVFYPLERATRLGLLLRVAHFEISDPRIPLMRTPGLPDPVSGKTSEWWLYDGEREWRVGPLTDELRELSIAEIWSHDVLVDRLTSGWTPRAWGIR